MIGYGITVTDDEGSFLIRCPDLPEVITFATSESEIERHAKDAIEEALAARIHDGEDIPVASLSHERIVKLPLMTVLKVTLYKELRSRNISRAELMRRLGWQRESVDRLFRLDHASKLEQLEAAFAAINVELDMAFKKVA